MSAARSTQVDAGATSPKDFTEHLRIDQACEEHRKICCLLLERDVPAAKNLMIGHIKRSEGFAKTLTLTQLAQKRIRALAVS